MAELSSTVSTVSKKEEVVVPEEIHLWCPRCQQGIDHKRGKGYRANDICPICEELYSNGHIAKDMVSILWNASDWEKEVARKGAIIREMNRKGTVTHIDTQNDGRIKQLEQQLADMQKMVATLQSAQKK